MTLKSKTYKDARPEKPRKETVPRRPEERGGHRNLLREALEELEEDDDTTRGGDVADE